MLKRKLETLREKYSTTTWYLLIGEKGATQFAIVTLKKSLGGARQYALDMGYHALEPQREAHHRRECKILPGGYCYYDGSMSKGEAMWMRFKETQDPNTIWEELEEYYNDLFGDN